MLLAVAALLESGLADPVMLPAARPSSRPRPAASASPTRSSRPTKPARPPKEPSSERRQHEPMQISEGELISLTTDLDEMPTRTLPDDAGRHRAERLHQLPRTSAAIGLEPAQLPDGAGSRARRHARPRGVRAARQLVIDADGEQSSTTDRAGEGRQATVDLAVAGLAAGLENLAVQTYQAGARRGNGRQARRPCRPRSPPSPRPAMAQHKDHAGAWNAVLTGRGQEPVTGVDMTVNDAVVKPGFAKVKDVGGPRQVRRSPSRTRPPPPT